MIYVTLAIFGLALGSFVNALVWRLHEQDEQVGKKHSEKQEQYVRDLSVTKGRSMCPYCQHQLAAKDLIPVLSYVSLGGKCRYCHHKIDDTPFSEIVTALLFILSYIYWPLDFHGVGTIEFVFWLIFLTGFMALAMYDLKWFLLPNRIVYPLLVLAVVQTLIVTLFYRGGWSFTEDAFLAALIGGGLFYLLFQISGGKWIGGGDVKLGLLLGIIVGNPLNACLLLFGSSLFGTLTTLPLIALGRAKRTSLIPYGPFLLVSAIVVRLFGASIILWLKQRSFLPATF